MSASSCDPAVRWVGASTDEELLDAWAHGDADAFGTLVRLHSPILVGAVRRLARPELAEEVIQETWMVVVAKIAGLRHRADFRAWLLAIGRNLARRRRQRERREHAVAKAPAGWRMSLLQQEDWIQGAASEAPDPCRGALAKEQLARTRLAFRRLSERDRAVVRQTVSGPSQEEPRGGGASAVRVSRFRARRRLAWELRD